MKLSKEQIQFIDKYLKSSGVVYVDIRLEMVDHIASGVEELMETENEDFYDAFKKYMMIHKKEILKNNKRWYSFSGIKPYLIFLAKPYMLTIGILMFLFFQKADVTLYFSRDFTVNNLCLVTIVSLAGIQELYLKFYFKRRFYVLEKMSLVLFLIYQAQIFFFNGFDKEKAPAFTLTIFSYLLIGYIIFFVKELKKFNKHHYNFI